MRSIHFRALPGLILACLLLAAATGSLAYLFQLGRVDTHLLHLAQVESAHLLDASASNGDLDKGMSLLTQGQFLLARIYDPAGHLLGQAVSRQADRRLANYASPTPLPFDLEHARSQRVRIDTVSVLELSLPLVRDGHTWALLQGIYQASPANQKAIHDEILNGVALVVLAVLVTAIVVHRLTISLYRRLSRPSTTAQAGNLEVLEVVGNMIASRDAESSAHNYRVTLYALSLAHEAGLPESAMNGLIAGSFLHDIGKITVSDAILRKPQRLSESEVGEMRLHVRRGVDLVKRSRWLCGGTRDHRVPPREVRRQRISSRRGRRADPAAARIFAIAEVFDALTSVRPYKSAASLEDALEIITREAGRHFDPRLVADFLVIAADVHGKWQHAAEDVLRAALEPHLNAACGL